jgi:hypothetical protein
MESSSAAASSTTLVIDDISVTFRIIPRHPIQQAVFTVTVPTEDDISLLQQELQAIVQRIAANY